MYPRTDEYFRILGTFKLHLRLLLFRYVDIIYETALSTNGAVLCYQMTLLLFPLPIDTAPDVLASTTQS